MTHSLETHRPLLGLGMTSLVLGVIALLVFLLPVLGIPIAAFGLVFGIVGFGVALYSPGSNLRWSLGGIALCLLALGINVAIAEAPAGTLSGRRVPELWQQPSDRPYVSPPARPD